MSMSELKTHSPSMPSLSNDLLQAYLNPPIPQNKSINKICLANWIFSFSTIKSWSIGTSRTWDIFIAISTDGIDCPFSIDIIERLETPIDLASISCVIVFSSLHTLIVFVIIHTYLLIVECEGFFTFSIIMLLNQNVKSIW